ncbi:MAG: GNAT family N-acetyltransferase [Bacteriovoracaceae bacterium]|jgi:GNAT superfamily N-acetyltransferase|nr:GNAT family N-acetyltransferase [Bacteriovoracaceae bacterium]
MIEYRTKIGSVNADQLKGFFVGWPNPPSEETFLRLLKGSYRIVIAIKDNKIIGFVTAVSDGVLSAYIPLIEVLPEYQSKGIGKELLARMKNELSHLYMIDLLCDEGLIPYYEKQGMSKATGALIRNYESQNGSGHKNG